MVIGQGMVDIVMQALLDGPRRLAHPEHHRHQHDHGNDADARFEEFLRLLGELRADKLQGRASEQRQGNGKQNANPDCGQPLAAAGLAKIGGDDAGDQGRFDAFAQHDQKWSEHWLAFTKFINVRDPGCFTEAAIP
jgi:hypothetical protein